MPRWAWLGPTVYRPIDREERQGLRRFEGARVGKGIASTVREHPQIGPAAGGWYNHGKRGSST